MNIEENELNKENFNAKEYFEDFIKNKSIEELLSYDNKLFSEIKQLETEKHSLVTQNYKKFVIATETINNIKSSLSGFQNNLINLQNKIGSLVDNFNIVNKTIEPRLSQTQQIYQVKKDLKRLKFVNDLPTILEQQLNIYLEQPKENKDLSVLEKSLNYYEKCKNFLELYKDNPLIKDIYQNTMNIIGKYRRIISDQLNEGDFKEFSMEKFESCIALLVKFESDHSELILTFIDRYKTLITRKFDEIFSMNEGVQEIDYKTYVKIYHNYEFSINENEFLFYENQINENINEDSSEKQLSLTNLASKYFKKGSFVWIIKKVCETILNSFIQSCYSTFIRLFKDNQLFHLNLLYNHMIETFFKKVKDILMNSQQIHPKFFNEGLFSFFTSFMTNLDKLDCRKIMIIDLTERISSQNAHLVKLYLKNIIFKQHRQYIELLKEKISKISSMGEFNRALYYEESKDMYETMFMMLKESLKNLKNLNFSDILNVSQNTTFNYYLNEIKCFVSFFFVLINFTNKDNLIKELIKIEATFKLTENDKEELFISFYNLDKVNRKERIIFLLYLIKFFQSPPILANFSEKIIKDIDNLKAHRIQTEIKQYIENLITITYNNNIDALLKYYDLFYVKMLKELYFNYSFILEDEAAVYRLEFRDLLFSLFNERNLIFDVLDEENKSFIENKIGFNEALLDTSKRTKKLSIIEKEIQILSIRKMPIYKMEHYAPQIFLKTLTKIILKAINEIIKLQKFNTYGFHLCQIEINVIKYFFRENIINDNDNILNGFFFEIMKNCANNTDKVLTFDETLLVSIVEEFRKEFKEKFN